MACTHQGFSHSNLSETERNVVEILHSMEKLKVSTSNTKQESQPEQSQMMSVNRLPINMPDHLVAFDVFLSLSGLLDQFLQKTLDFLDSPLVHQIQCRTSNNFTFYQMLLPQDEQIYRGKLDLWEPEKRYQIASFPRTVTYAMFDEKAFITITDIYNVLEFRLEVLGFCVLRPSEMKSIVYSNLRPIQDKSWSLNQESTFLKALNEVGCIAMRRDQKVYSWSEANHSHLVLKAIECIFKHNKISPTPPPLAKAIRQPALSLMANGDVQSLFALLKQVAPNW